ncbi:hypothetical protein G6F31_018589 [Rhizopus arrhizus]|nr:hypothetical protein G6F31_018589 [Rhizopus arrhizus]
MLVLETALPAKFSETIEEALGRPATPPGNLANLESLPQRVEVMDCSEAAVRHFIEANAKVLGLEGFFYDVGWVNYVLMHFDHNPTRIWGQVTDTVNPPNHTWRTRP